jgi:hypothetical protein
MLFADNIYETNMHEWINLYIYKAIPLINPPSLLLYSIHVASPLHIYCPFYLLGDPFSCDRGANIHPLSSLVSSQLFTPCCLTHPEDTQGSS